MPQNSTSLRKTAKEDHTAKGGRTAPEGREHGMSKTRISCVPMRKKNSDKKVGAQGKAQDGQGARKKLKITRHHILKYFATAKTPPAI